MGRLMDCREPDLYIGQDLVGQLSEILWDGVEVEESLLDLLDRLAARVVEDEEGSTTRQGTPNVGKYRRSLPPSPVVDDNISFCTVSTPLPLSGRRGDGDGLMMAK
jgi:hypothetical protein